MYTFKVWDKIENIGVSSPETIIAENPLFANLDILIIFYGKKLVEYSDVETVRYNNFFGVELTSEQVGQAYIDIKNGLIKPSPSLENKVLELEAEKERLNIAIKEQDDLLINATYRIAELEKTGVIKSV